MKPLESLSIRGLNRRRNALANLPISEERVTLINQIDTLIASKLGAAPTARKRGRPRIHRKYQGGITTRSGQPQR